MKPDFNDWLGLLIFIAVVGGAYLYLSDYDNKREKIFAEIDECIEKNNIAFSKEIFEKGAEENPQLIQDDIDRVSKEIISLCTEGI